MNAENTERRGGRRAGAGRKSHAELGLEARSERVMCRFTPRQLAELERAAEAEGLSVSELVAQRAMFVEAK